jgi:two-component system nitrogen regulation response regulator NtrX
MDWMMIMRSGETEVFRAEHLPTELAAHAPRALAIDPAADVMALPLREARDVFETQYLQAQLLRHGGNISRTANFVGMERSALHRKLKQLGIGAEERAAV